MKRLSHFLALILALASVSPALFAQANGTIQLAQRVSGRWVPINLTPIEGYVITFNSSLTPIIAAPSGGGGSGAWGGITGTLSDQTDLNTALGLRVLTSTLNGHFADPSTNGSFSPSAWRADLGLVIGTNVQAYSANLAEFAAVDPSSDALALMGAANYAAMRGLLGLGGAAVFNVGTTAGTVAAGDDARINGALQATAVDTPEERYALGFKSTTGGNREVLQDHGNLGATETFDLASANVHAGVLDANLTPTLSGFSNTATEASSMVLKLKQDGTGSRTVTWPAAVLGSPEINPTADAVTIVTLLCFGDTDEIFAVSDYSTSGGGGTWGSITGDLEDQTDLQAALDGKAPVPTVNAQTGTSYTLVIGDANKVVTMDNASANTLTIPPNASVALPAGSIVVIGQLGAGATSIDPDSGVTLNGGTSTITMSGQRTWLSLLKTGTNAWETYGGDFVIANGAITGATKTKITYDAKGLVTAGADATTADIADSSNKRYVTDAQLTVIGNTSGTNTGDQTTVTGNAGTATALQTARTINGVSFNGTANIVLPEVWVIPLGDETTAITTGTAKVTFRAPFAATVTGVRASLTTVSSSGTPTFDINESTTSILSTLLTIDASEKTSTTAAAAAVVSDTAIADDAEITIDIDTAGTGAAGAKISIYVTR